METPTRADAAARLDAWASRLLPVLDELLETALMPFKETDLLKALSARSIPGFGAHARRDREGLYRQHFLLYHALYRLDAQRVAEGRPGLSIHCLAISCRPPGKGEALPITRDPVRDYYLDPANLDLSPEEIQALLSGGLQRIRNHQSRADALAVLGLEDPVTDQAIRARYRQLSARHHPDRGGDPRRQQELNEAAQILLKG